MALVTRLRKFSSPDTVLAEISVLTNETMKADSSNVNFATLTCVRMVHFCKDKIKIVRTEI